MFPQKVQLKDGLYYVFSGNVVTCSSEFQKSINIFILKINNLLCCNTAWVQASKGSENSITAAFNYSSGAIFEIGTVVASHGCWSMLKGGVVANVTAPAHIIFKV